MSSQPIDKQLFKTLVPINALKPENFAELLSKCSAEVVPAGRFLFKRGDTDKKSVYLLAGEVDLTTEKNEVFKKIVAGTEAARHPIGHTQPRQLSAKAVKDCTIVRVDSDWLDVLLTWDQTGNYEVVDIKQETAEEEGGDWMTRLLATRSFHRIPPANLQAMFMAMEEVHCQAGDTVIKQGDEGDYFYIISRGKAQVIRETPNKPEGVTLATLKEGDSFGEEALISNARRNATIRMLTPGSLMRLSKANFEKLLKEPLLKWISLEEAKQLVVKGAQLIDVRLPGEFEKWHIKGSTNLPLYFLRSKLDTLQPGRPLVVCCDTGRRSSAAAYILNERGFDAYVLKDGLQRLVPPDA